MHLTHLDRSCQDSLHQHGITYHIHHRVQFAAHLLVGRITALLGGRLAGWLVGCYCRILVSMIPVSLLLDRGFIV